MADPLDLIDLTEGYEAINNPSGSGHDTEMARAITGLSRIIDDLCGPVVVRTVTDETHDGGAGSIWLRETPVDSVTSIVEYDGTTGTTLTAETNATKPGDGYLLEARRHFVRLVRRSGSGDTSFAGGRQNVVVTYEAGRYDDTGSVDPKFKMAAASILRRLWKREGSAWAQGGNPFSADVGSPGFFNAVDHIVSEQLAREKRPPVVA